MLKFLGNYKCHRHLNSPELSHPHFFSHSLMLMLLLNVTERRQAQRKEDFFLTNKSFRLM